MTDTACEDEATMSGRALLTGASGVFTLDGEGCDSFTTSDAATILMIRSIRAMGKRSGAWTATA